MSARLKELRQKRATLVTQMREAVAAAQKENRSLTAEETTQFDRLETEANGLKDTYEREERVAALEARLAGEGDGGAAPTGEQRTAGASAIPEVRSAAEGRYGIRAEEIDDTIQREVFQRRSSAQYNHDFRRFLRTGEKRALDATSFAGGGASVLPVQFAQDLIKTVDDMLFVRQRATVRSVVTAEALGIISLDADPADADWTAEIATGSEDTTMKLGRRELRPSPLAKLVKISRKLLRASSLDVAALVQQRLAYKMAVPQEKGFLVGSGANQSLGVMTASVDGIPTSRDVATGNSTTAIGFDGLINAKFALKAGYLKNAAWAFHRDGVKQISTLKDTTNQYLWQPSTQIGQPDRLLGLPVFMSEYMPNTFTTGLYVGIIGDFSYYYIADALDLQLQRLEELYAATNQVGFIIRTETDGQPVLGEAFARVKLA